MADLTTYDWVINGITPRRIESMDDSAYPKITLHCASKADDTFPDPRDEIEQFRLLAANTINNKILGNGGTDLQISSDGEIVTITNNGNSWNGALYYPQTPSLDDMAGNLIKYDLIFELQQTNNPASDVFIPDLRLYSNVDYSCWTNNPYSCITGKISKSVVPKGSKNVETITLGTFGFNWDGAGKVY
ncbi:MAG: hypothetical protein K8E24_014900, partial [Methanobacterium paludis]|nr:hypothetical protein [Methanobacterium paludis]